MTYKEDIGYMGHARDNGSAIRTPFGSSSNEKNMRNGLVGREIIECRRI